MGGGVGQWRPAHLVVVRGPFLHVLVPKRADDRLVADELGASFAQRLAREVSIEQILHQGQTGGRVEVREVDGQLLQEPRGELQGLRDLLWKDSLLVAGVVYSPPRQLLALRRDTHDRVDVLLQATQLHDRDAPHVRAVDGRACGLNAEGVFAARLGLNELVKGVGVEGAAARGAHYVHGLVLVDVLLDLARPRDSLLLRPRHACHHRRRPPFRLALIIVLLVLLVCVKHWRRGIVGKQFAH